MGTWGTGIYSNDVSEEVRDTYKNLLKDGKTNEEALMKTIEEGKDDIRDADTSYDFWFALSDTQSSLGRLHPEVKAKALELIKNGGDVERWLEVGDQKNARKRQEVLEKLKDKLNGPQPPEKKIPIRVVFRCPWKIGDVFAYRLENETAIEKGLLGRYLIIQKIKDMPWLHGAILPMVIVRMSCSTDLPTLDQIDNLEIVKVVEQKRIQISARVIEATSLRNIPPKLIFLGNYAKNLEEYNALVEKDVGYEFSLWKSFENDVIDDYISFNINNNCNVIVMPRGWDKIDRTTMEEMWRKHYEKGGKGSIK